MTAVMDHRPVVVPPIRQDVVDVLVGHLARDEPEAFARAQDRLDATRAEVAAASAGLVASGQLDLAALEHALEVLEGVVQLPGPVAA
ncbi:hypothetical protein HC251_17535 [Iamia sp. SCSIO 61187]|uniref:hypothetical protein n=1 Tax=Iamia sp. SCSIO 61187 TaxID=2722752 RepID=UPI001C637EB2|nr:hypothetical protein [Iamia sp. SCSIO 61187]QYG94063.1 hypothetical protein HC251_17535 [Iamia sp. SCSIO 61187]